MFGSDSKGKITRVIFGGPRDEAGAARERKHEPAGEGRPTDPRRETPRPGSGHHRGRRRCRARRENTGRGKGFALPVRLSLIGQ